MGRRSMRFALASWVVLGIADYTGGGDAQDRGYPQNHMGLAAAS